MEPLIEALASTDLAQVMRNSRWLYAAVSGGHVLGIALLIGAIGSLDLRLIGLWPAVPVEMLARVLVPVAVSGLSLAMMTGLMLFLAGPADYAQMSLFRVKLVLIAVGTGHALWFHSTNSFDGATVALRRVGVTSLIIWLAVLGCGRMLAFAG
ncbi:hypothetical protein [Paracoccus tegillarcae]|uniref:DUF2214 domain-containing protein n=1 Tax=Paracoccus tegillarcae TaxID=1529068 RepID=A0A2K9EIK1_9RHOB|nr:hypothetical protein [Paracoccus tegillarcae]AUH34810.1 hypothetical protein CUV01_16755 [Paracoccus tegillarcae]